MIKPSTQGQVKQMRNCASRDLKILVHRVVALEEQYKQVIGSLKQTIKRTEKMEEIKQKHQEVQGMRRQFVKQDIGFQKSRSSLVSQMNKTKQLEKQQVMNQIQQNKSEEYRLAKEQSETNKQRIGQEKHQQLMDKKFARDKILIEEEESKKSLQSYWVHRMQNYNQQHEQQKRIYQSESNKIQQKTIQLERFEDDILMKLQGSQLLQNKAADRLTALFAQPWDTYQLDFKPPRMIQQTVESNHNQTMKGTKSLTKLTMYYEPQVMRDPQTNKVLQIRGLPKLGIDKPNLFRASKKSVPDVIRSHRSHTAMSQKSERSNKDKYRKRDNSSDKKQTIEQPLPQQNTIVVHKPEHKQDDQPEYINNVINQDNNKKQLSDQSAGQLSLKSLEYELSPDQKDDGSPNLEYSPDPDQIQESQYSQQDQIKDN